MYTFFLFSRPDPLLQITTVIDELGKASSKVIMTVFCLFLSLQMSFTVSFSLSLCRVCVCVCVSPQAQQLPAPITSAAKLQTNRHHLYLLKDGEQNGYAHYFCPSPTLWFRFNLFRCQYNWPLFFLFFHVNKSTSAVNNNLWLLLSSQRKGCYSWISEGWLQEALFTCKCSLINDSIIKSRLIRDAWAHTFESRCINTQYVVIASRTNGGRIWRPSHCVCWISMWQRPCRDMATGLNSLNSCWKWVSVSVLI